MAAIGQELRPAVAVLALGGIQVRHLNRRATTGGDPVHRTVEGGRENDRSLAVPRSAATVWSIAEHLCRSTSRGDCLELAFSKESDETTVRRPERIGRVLRPRELLTGCSFQRTQPQHLFSICAQCRIHQPSAIRRNREWASVIPNKSKHRFFGGWDICVDRRLDGLRLSKGKQGKHDASGEQQGGRKPKNPLAILPACCYKRRKSGFRSALSDPFEL